MRAECNKVVSLSLFTTAYTKSVTDEEYKTTQDAALLATKSYLTDTWSSAIKSAVRNSLKEVGKGWFNLNETVSEVYQMSKLKRYLKMVNFIMQDSVVYMAEASLRAYTSFVIERSAFDCEVISPSDVKVRATAASSFLLLSNRKTERCQAYCTTCTPHHLHTTYSPFDSFFLPYLPSLPPTTPSSPSTLHPTLTPSTPRPTPHAPFRLTPRRKLGRHSTCRPSS